MKRIVYTGTTSGIGLATAKLLAEEGHHLILACRNVELAERQKEEMIQSTGNRSIEVMKLDLASFKSIEDFVAEITEKYKYIDVLINNAGLYADRKVITPEGFELTLAVNFIGTYYLSKLLVPILEKGKNPRIANVASTAAFNGKVKIKNSYFQKHRHGFKAYSASKAMLLMMNIELAEELKGKIMVNAIHPGVVNTNIFKGEGLAMKLVKPFIKLKYDKSSGCETTIYVSTSDELNGITAQFYRDKNELVKYNNVVSNRELRKELMEYTNKEISLVSK